MCYLRRHKMIWLSWGVVGSLLAKFRDHFPDHDLASISPEEVFLNQPQQYCKQLTKHSRYPYLKALFNFIPNNLDVPKSL